MRAPDQVVDIVRKRLEADWSDPDKASRWPLRIPLRVAAKIDAERDFPAVHAWASTWQGWVAEKSATLDWANRKVHGTLQPLPTHLVVASADFAATIMGPPWPALLAQARERRARLSEHFPQQEPGPIVRACAALNDTDFDLLLAAAEWFTLNDAAGLSPRQVPIPGLHAKWLDAHGALVGRLSGLVDLGLVGRPGVVRYAYLDPPHLAAGGARYGAVTVIEPDAALSPAYQPDVVVIVENLDTMLHFPPLTAGIVVCGWGSAATLLAHLRWLRKAPRVVYWGDIDTSGFEILDRLRRDGIHAVSVLMDVATLREYAEFASPTDASGRPLGPRLRKDTPTLTAEEREAYESLTSPDGDGPWRLEQERIPLGVGLAAVTAAVLMPTFLPGANQE